MKPQEIRELTESEREEKLKDFKEELFNLKFQAATGKIQNPGRIQHLRRDIARILTVAREAKANQPAAATENAKG